MTAQRIVLLRHGRTTYNAAGRFQGQLDVPLDETGLDQAKCAAEALADQLDGQPVTIVSSDLRRAALTAQTLADRLGLTVTHDERLREVNGGEWQGLVGDEIRARWPDQYAAWLRGEDVRTGGAERRSEAGTRACAAILEITETLPDAATAVCVSHGAALRAAIVQLVGLPAWQWTFLSALSNAHWADLRPGRTGGWRLHSYNAG